MAIVGILFNWIPLPFFRYLSVSIVVTQIVLEFKSDRKLFLTSPLFLISAISMFFFSFMLGIAEHTPLLGMPDYAPSIKTSKIFQAVGSSAEKYILAFSMSSLLIHQMIALFKGEISRTQEPSYIIKYNNIHILCAALILSLTIYNNVLYHNNIIKESIILMQIKYISFPIQSFSIVYLIRGTMNSTRSIKFFAIFTIFISIVGMFSVHEGKIPLFIAISSLLYWYRISCVSFRKVVLGALVSLLFAIVGIQTMQSIRQPDVSLWNRLLTKNLSASVNMFVTVLESKTIWRQTETVYCLQNVINQHSEQPFVVAKQLFWLQALVPRIIWPGKPNLSMGADYSTQYCGFPSKGIHSSAITLLGQPIINGGQLGLILHVGLLLCGLGGLVWLSRTPSSLASSAIAALLPWLIDFDQDFALLIANAVKFFLVLLPFIFIAGISERNQYAGWIFARLGLPKP